MNRSDIETMTEPELAALAASYLDILWAGEHVPSMKSECRAARRSLARLFSFLPERVTEIGFPYCPGDNRTSYRQLTYPIVYKQIGTIKYHTDGCLHNQQNYHTAYGDPWEPKDKGALKRYENRYHDCELQYKKWISGDDIEERMRAEKAANEKKFLNSFKKFNHLLMKYQYYRYLNKKFVTPRRFLIDGKKFYEVMEHLEQIMDGNIPTAPPDEDSTPEQKEIYRQQMLRFEVIQDKLDTFLGAFYQITQHYSCRDYFQLDFYSFVSDESIKDADKTYSIKCKHRYNNFDYDNNYTHALYEIKSNDFPEDEKFNRYAAEYHRHDAAFMTIYKSLAYYRMFLMFNNITVLYLRDFCQAMGFIPPDEKKDKEGENSGTEK